MIHFSYLHHLQVNTAGMSSAYCGNHNNAFID